MKIVRLAPFDVTYLVVLYIKVCSGLLLYTISAFHEAICFFLIPNFSAIFYY